MNKKIIFLMLLISLTIFSQTGNAILKFVSPSDYVDVTEKFNGKKDIFKKAIQQNTNKVKLQDETGSRLKSVFTTTMSVIQVGKKWCAIIYYNQSSSETTSVQKRLVVTGETSLKVDGFTYKLTPLRDGVNIKDVRSGDIYKLEVKGR